MGGSSVEVKLISDADLYAFMYHPSRWDMKYTKSLYY